MGETMIYLVLFASLCVNALAIEGVKGGHRPRYPTSGSQHSGVNNGTDSGLCYKRVPYSQILALNATGAIAYNTIPVPQPGTQTDVDAGWITILDCCDGFKRNATTSKCEFHCQDGCFGGRCTGPNVCSCDPGWFPDKGVCMPYCSKPCQKDAYCFAPETCICKLGYDDANGECKPICPGGCKNGECIAPRLCRCKPGYMLNDLQECIPVCEGGCPHGDCTSPGVCTCYEGYVNPPTDRESCVPNCPGNCNDGGECISPGVCNCRQGFDRDPTGTCVAKIIPLTPNNANPCRCGPNGVCIAPNTCQCRPGYSLNRSTGECIISSVDSSQSSYCEKPCINGDCTGYNQCTCKHGYVLDQTDPTRTRCVPLCLNGCVNGVCSAPNFCICNQGYVKDRSVKGSQKCIPQTSRV